MIYLLTRNGRQKQIRRFVKIYALSLTKWLFAPDIKIYKLISSAQVILSHVFKFIIIQDLFICKIDYVINIIIMIYTSSYIHYFLYIVNYNHQLQFWGAGSSSSFRTIHNSPMTADKNSLRSFIDLVFVCVLFSAAWTEGTQLFTRCKGSNRYEVQKWDAAHVKMFVRCHVY